MIKIRRTNMAKYGSLHIGDYFVYDNEPYIVSDRVQAKDDEYSSINLTSGRTHMFESNIIVEVIVPTLEY